MSEKTNKYLIKGRVQGVGFRAFTESSARELGLKGYVRNLPDGSVEAVAHGPVDDLFKFENRLEKGPALARVIDIEKQQIDNNTDFHEFRITR